MNNETICFIFIIALFVICTLIWLHMFLKMIDKYEKLKEEYKKKRK